MTLQTTLSQSVASAFILAGLLFGFKSFQNLIRYHRRQMAQWKPQA